jgi:putative Holliday junction resolvase
VSDGGPDPTATARGREPDSDGDGDGGHERERPGRGTGRSTERGTGRVAALDLGSRRIGVAYCDSRRTLASPWGTIERSGDAARDRAAVVDAVREVEAEMVVVGLPLSLSGHAGPAAQAALEESEQLRTLLEPLGVAVEMADERLTTVEAQRNLRAAGRSGRAARQVVDSAAAMVLLQSWLERP